MAQLYCTGPVSLFALFSTGSLAGSTVFLGHSERTPNISLRPYFSDVHSDLSGQQNPLDKMYQGQSAMITLDLVRFNYNVYQVMADRVTLGGTLPGTDGPGAIGTLMQTEGYTYQLFARFPYAAKAPFAGSASGTGSGGAMIPGYRFLAATLIGPDEITSGTVPHKIRCVWYAMPAFTITQNNLISGASLITYDYLNFNTLPAIN